MLIGPNGGGLHAQPSQPTTVQTQADPAAARATRGAQGCGAWQGVPVPFAGTDATLWSVDGASANDVWAVGAFYSPLAHVQIQHWDGQQWNPVADGAADLPVTALRGVEVVASNDVWAVGLYNAVADGTGPIQLGGVWSTLIEHWDGVTWSIVPSGTHAAGILNAIAVAGPNDIWAVGNATVANTVVTLHWDGSTWTRVDNGLSAIALDDITVIGPDDAWAVGTGPDIGPLTAHWDGKSWSPVPSVTGFTLHSVQAFGPDAVWAVGQTRTESLSARYSDPCLRGSTAPRFDSRPLD